MTAKYRAAAGLPGRPVLACLVLLATGLYSGPAWATLNIAEQTSLTALQWQLEQIWLIGAAVLVLLMQVGFLLLESGLVRAKNSINVAQKNVADIILSTAVFAMVGFTVMFGASHGGLYGYDSGLLFFRAVPAELLAFFIFQLVFCGTAATIVSGAVAERTGILGYLGVIFLIAVLIYPVFGHWAWGDAVHNDQAPLLAGLGFVDLAGATVVHSVGAWVALAAVLVVGPRLDKFDVRDGRPRAIQGHNSVIASAGCLLLWIGWIGFNGGSISLFDPLMPMVVSNTLLAGAAGGLVQMALGYGYDRLFRPARSINGVLSGLVSITACAHLVDGVDAIVIGALGSLIAMAGRFLLERLLGVDDAIGAIPVHGFAGIWGTLAVALFGAEQQLPAGGTWAQLLVQLEGVGLAFLWAFGVSYAILKTLHAVLRSMGFEGLRVAREHEIEGLNSTEHGASLGTGMLQRAMLALAHGEPNWNRRVQVEPGDEAAELGAAFNRVLDKLEREHSVRIEEHRDQAAAIEQALAKEKELNALQRKFVSMVSHEFRTPVTIIDGAAQRMERRADRLDAEDVDKGLGKIRRAVKRITSLIDNTLDATRVFENQVKFEPTTIDIHKLLESICANQQEVSPSHRLSLDIARLPKQIHADPSLVEQVFDNLLSNAIKYSPNNPDIELRGWQERGYAVFSVTDFGLGIPEDELPKIFNRFFRARTSEGIPGTGIGLDIVKEFIEMHGGSICASSREGKGSTFALLLPISPKARSEKKPSQAGTGGMRPKQPLPA